MVKKQSESSAAAPKAPLTFGPLLRECLLCLDEGVSQKDSRAAARAVRRIMLLRRSFDTKIFLEFVNQLATLHQSPWPAAADLFNEAFQGDPAPKTDQGQTDDVEMKSAGESGEAVSQGLSGRPSSPATFSPSSPATEELRTRQPLSNVVGNPEDYKKALPDIELFLMVLAMMALIDIKDLSKAVSIAAYVVKVLSVSPPVKLDPLLVSKAIFYACRVHELLSGNFTELRRFLMSTFRSAVLHRHLAVRAVCLNLLLRNCLQENQYDQAVQLLEKAPYPHAFRSNVQYARYLYYLVSAARLDYGEAYNKALQAIRRGPQEGAPCGHGFRLAAHKFAFVVQLLMGEIPERHLFNQKHLRHNLAPYAKIVQAVRSGDLVGFKRAMDTYQGVFRKDGSLDLMQRLHHNVIRAGLKRINASYSVISLNDIATKLGLSSVEDTECIVAKAIADGVLEAKIDFADRTVRSRPQTPSQISDGPRRAFHGRIAFCLQLYSDAIKAMQYPVPEKTGKIKEAEARRKEHQEQLARAEKDEFDGGDDGDLI